MTDAEAAPSGVPEAISAELVEARDEFFAALDALPAARRDAPDLVGEWGVRARVARAASLATVRQREQASIDALLVRLQRLDPALLDVQLGTWGTLEAGLREDGPVHY